jgi:ATP-dependent DNA ligase
MVRACKRGEDPIAFYNEIVSLPLPFGEGVVVKAAGDPTGGTWFKVKQVDFADLELVEVLPGTGKYSDSVGRLVVRNPENGALGEVGSFAITDERREWIWTHRENVVGAVVKIRVQEITDRGAPRAGVFMDFHEGKGPTEAGLLMYAESLAGADPEETTRIKYKLISSAGWRR